jgi:hypothetical protein
MVQNDNCIAALFCQTNDTHTRCSESQVAVINYCNFSNILLLGFFLGNELFNLADHIADLRFLREEI